MSSDGALRMMTGHFIGAAPSSSLVRKTPTDGSSPITLALLQLITAGPAEVMISLTLPVVLSVMELMTGPVLAVPLQTTWFFSAGCAEADRACRKRLRNV